MISETRHTFVDRACLSAQNAKRPLHDIQICCVRKPRTEDSRSQKVDFTSTCATKLSKHNHASPATSRPRSNSNFDLASQTAQRRPRPPPITSIQSTYLLEGDSILLFLFEDGRLRWQHIQWHLLLLCGRGNALKIHTLRQCCTWPCAVLRKRRHLSGR